MVRLIAPNGTPANVGEELAKRLVASGFVLAAASPAEVSENAEVPSTAEAPVKRKPGRPRKAVALPAPKPEKTEQ